MRDKVLSQIAKKAGIKIVKESAEQIRASAEKADGGRFKNRVPQSSPMDEAAMSMLRRERDVLPVDYYHGRDGKVYFFETREADKVYGYRPLFSIAVLGNEDMLNELTIGIENGTISTTKGLRDVVSSLRVQEGGSPVSYSRVKKWKRLARYEPADNSDIRRDGETSHKGADYQNDSVHGEQSGIKPLERRGTIYGYFDPVRRELHLNEDFADFDTPIHEWTHVWWAWLKGEDPRMIERWRFAPTKKAADASMSKQESLQPPKPNVRNDSADKLNEVKKDSTESNATNTSRRKHVLEVWVVRHNSKSGLRQ